MAEIWKIPKSREEIRKKWSESRSYSASLEKSQERRRLRDPARQSPSLSSRVKFSILIDFSPAFETFEDPSWLRSEEERNKDDVLEARILSQNKKITYQKRASPKPPTYFFLRSLREQIESYREKQKEAGLEIASFVPRSKRKKNGSKSELLSSNDTFMIIVTVFSLVYFLKFASRV
jgi:hypothetical protein